MFFRQSRHSSALPALPKKQKLAESDSLLYKTRRQETLGLKGMADVAQMEAQQASDAYNLTHQQNLYETAMLTLKQKMNFPIEEALLLDTCLLEQSTLEQEVDADRNLWAKAGREHRSSHGARPAGTCNAAAA